MMNDSDLKLLFVKKKESGLKDKRIRKALQLQSARDETQDSDCVNSVSLAKSGKMVVVILKSTIHTMGN